MDASPPQRAFAEATLVLADSGRDYTDGPSGIVIGRLEFSGWQIHRLAPTPASLSDRQAFLIRAGYEFDIAPDVDPPEWAEIEFQFEEHAPHPESERGPVVHSALPFRITSASPLQEYQLTAELEFAQRADSGRSSWPAGSIAERIPMPSLTPVITCSGVDKNYVRWRHTEGLMDGAHQTWFVLTVPAGQEAVAVVAGGRYQILDGKKLRLAPDSRPDAFQVPLPALIPATRSTGGESVVAESHRDLDDLPRGSGSRVFISYAEESPEHQTAVEDLCQVLEKAGIDVRYARQCAHQRVNWEQWTTTNLLKADYVIVVASLSYARAGRGELGDHEHRGVRSEFDRLVDLQHRDRTTWARKILPVVLPGGTPDDIPLSFLPGTATYYEVDPLAPGGTDSLLWVIGSLD